MYPGQHMILMALGWLIAIAVGGFVVWLMLALVTGHRRSTSDQSPEKILRRRLAEGEIDAEEYEKRSQAVSKHKQAA